MFITGLSISSHRSQRIKLASGCYSKWGPIPSRVPQGTNLARGCLFSSSTIWTQILHIYGNLWTTPRPRSKSKREILVTLRACPIRLSSGVLNPDKCKEMRVSFARDPECFDAITIDGKELEVVKNAKLLGLTISDNLTWNSHVNEIIKKASKKSYLLAQLKRARVPPSDLVLFYKACVRSGVDYAVPVFYNALPQYLKNELVRIEKREFLIILSRTGYSSACSLLGITPITEHHSLLGRKLFDQICSDTGHKLNSLLPPRNEPKYNLRNHRPFAIPTFENKSNQKHVHLCHGSQL